MGWAFTLAGGVIRWSSKKINCVAKSTSEAEYISLSTTACHAIQLDWILTELREALTGQTIREPALILDNN